MGGQERDIKSPIAGISAEAAISDRNLFGSGIQLNASARFSKDERSFLFSLADPWLFDEPLFGKLDAYYRSLSYDGFNHTLSPVNERDAGANGTLGFVTNMHSFRLLSDIFIRFNVGIDSIRYPQPAKPNITAVDRVEATYINEIYGNILDKLFKPGEYVWLTANMGQDTKNHPTHPSRGHTWLFRAQLAVPAFGGCIGFNKFDLDFNWFTPLIMNMISLSFSTVLLALRKAPQFCIPFRDLFNMAVPQAFAILIRKNRAHNSLSTFRRSLGGSKLLLECRVMFPINGLFNLKRCSLYDGGTGGIILMFVQRRKDSSETIILIIATRLVLVSDSTTLFLYV
jgi:outer membrane protein assembly factor BamA